ncbi:MAG: hypothetical protein H0X73_06350 [Chthoniobacterales bacterium]|nr:hypothetical protein [Chthoniobacterales bacterium]
MKRSCQIATALAALTILPAPPSSYPAENDLADIKAEVAKRYDEAVKAVG